MAERDKIQVRSMKTKDRLRHFAADAFAEVGYGGASLRDIAQHSGVTVAALYNHYSSKETLLRDVIVQTVTELRALLQKS